MRGDHNGWYARACACMPGGVNSPVRSFGAVGGVPPFLAKADGQWLWDEAGNRYLDCLNSWGAMLLGHGHAAVKEAAAAAMERAFSFGAPHIGEVLLAEQVAALVPSIEQVRMVNSGTEALMSVVRLARGFTQRDKIIQFEGCYHGHGDNFLASAGSGLATLALSASAGVPKGAVADTCIAHYNDIASVRRLFAAHSGQIAAVLIEPVAGNMGCVLPEAGFLAELRQCCDEAGALLIFDEVMTGFRVQLGGAQEHYGVRPDLTTLGKVLGGGMPVGAYGGRRDIMQHVSPVGAVYQAGTLSGNPMGMATGYATLCLLADQADTLYPRLQAQTTHIAEALHVLADRHEIPHQINHIGSMLTLFFTPNKVGNFAQAKGSDVQQYASFFHHMLEQGVYLPCSQFEAWFFSAAIGEEEVAFLLRAAEHAFAAMRRS